jgi:DNA-binding MarR family transcriptional regulator
MNSEDQKQDRRTLEVLSAIDSGSGISQRRLASQMGIALGLTNSYIKRCVRKGFIKINEAPANRYLYYLTPKGFREKTRLTARFLSNSLDFYRAAANSCDQVYNECVERGVDSVLLCGDSELAEIAFLKSLDSAVEVIGLFDADSVKTRFFSRPVWRCIDGAPNAPRIVTSLTDAEAMRSFLCKRDPGLKVFVPGVLGLHPGQIS